jgi:DNA-binding transcriptional LysR family regulator
MDQDAEIDLHKVRYFLAVGYHLHFGRGAHEFFVAQPALSRAIRALDGDLGTQLFDRDHYRVELTDAGRGFVGEARRSRNGLTASSPG